MHDVFVALGEPSLRLREERVESKRRDLSPRQPYGRQGWKDGPAHLNVVEANHGDLARHVDSPLMQGANRPDRA